MIAAFGPMSCEIDRSHQVSARPLCYIIRVMSPRRTRDAANRRGYPTRKPLARKKIPADIRSLCRAYTDEGVRVLASIMRQPEHPPAVRVQAASILLDRGWGRVPPKACPIGALGTSVAAVLISRHRDWPICFRWRPKRPTPDRRLWTDSRRVFCWNDEAVN